MAKSRNRKGNSFFKGAPGKWIDLYDIHRLEDGEIFSFGHSGSVGKVFKYRPILDCDFDNPLNVQKLGMTISRFIQEVSDPNITIAFHFIRKKDIKMNEKLAKDRVMKQKDGLVHPMPDALNEREKMFRLMANSGEIFEDGYYISLRVDFSKENLSFIQKAKMTLEHIKSFLGKDVDGDLDSASFEVTERVIKLITLSKDLKSTLKSVGLHIEDLKTVDEYLELYSNYLKPDVGSQIPVTEEKIDENTSPVNALMGGSFVEDYPNHLVIDNYIYQLYELEKVNPYRDFDFQMIRNFKKYPMEFAYTVMFSGLSKSDGNQSIKKAMKSMDREISMSTNSKGDVEDLELVERKKLAQAVNDEILRDGKGAVEYSVTFLAKIPMKKAESVMAEKRLKTYNQFLYDFEKNLKSDLFWSFGDSEWSLVRYGQWSALGKVIPGVCTINTTFLKTFIERPACVTLLLPIATEVDLEAPHLGFNHFLTPSRNVFPYEVMSKNLHAHVTTITGDMGRGKTVLLNLLTMYSYTSLLYSGKPPLIRIVDSAGIESSFFKFVKGVNGTVISFIGSAPPCIQLLEIDPFASVPNARKKKELAHFVASNNKNMSEKEALKKIVLFYRQSTNGSGDKILSHRERERLVKELLGVEAGGYEHFILKPGDCAPSSDEMIKIMDVFELMLSKDAKNPEAYSIFNAQEIEDLIYESYNVVEERFPSITDVYELLKKKLENTKVSDHRPYQLLKMLKRWTAEHGVNPSFDLPTNINLEDDCIMFDTFGLDKDPIVEGIYNILIFRIIGRDMYTKDSRVRYVAMDEYWKNAKSAPAERTLKEFTRLSRKYKFGLLLASQILEDAFKVSNDLGESIITQTTTFIFCGNSSPTAIDQIRNRLRIDEKYLSTIPTLGIYENNGEDRDLYESFARFMVYRITKGQKERFHILDCILSPLEFELLNSNGEDNAITNYLMRHRNMTILEACKYMMSKGHIGDENLLANLLDGNHVEAVKKCLPPNVTFEQFLESKLAG